MTVSLRDSKEKRHTHLFNSFKRSLTEAPLTSTTSKITIISYLDTIYKGPKKSDSGVQQILFIPDT